MVIEHISTTDRNQISLRQCFSLANVLFELIIKQLEHLKIKIYDISVYIFKIKMLLFEKLFTWVFLIVTLNETE